ncbi:MAG: hypothetical protein RLZZ400_39 [Actinomycetota bacterium]
MKTSENWLGRELTLNIEKVAHGGIFVARHEGRVVFVTGAITGEQVIARVFEDKGGAFCRAEVLRVIDPSAHRVKHFWKAVRERGAGGAEFGHIDLEYQRELKADVLEEALDRFAGVKLRVPVEAAPGDIERNGLGYRTRVKLHVDEFGTAGPVRERSHEVVVSGELPLAVDDIRELELHKKNWSGVSKLEIATSNTGQVQYLVDGKVNGDQRLLERVAGRTFRVSAGGFWQVHREAPQLLAGTVIEMCEQAGFDVAANNLDLYGGVGLFAGALVNHFGSDTRFTTVESFRKASDDAKLNLADLKNVKVVCAPTEKFLRQLISAEPAGLGNATVVIDPPRSGAGGGVVRDLLALRPQHIVYVACDPIALARDLKGLLADYNLATIRAFDLFPHTHHLEAVASLVRK